MQFASRKRENFSVTIPREITQKICTICNEVTSHAINNKNALYLDENNKKIVTSYCLN